MDGRRTSLASPAQMPPSSSQPTLAPSEGNHATRTFHCDSCGATFTSTVEVRRCGRCGRLLHASPLPPASNTPDLLMEGALSLVQRSKSLSKIRTSAQQSTLSRRAISAPPRPTGVSTAEPALSGAMTAAWIAAAATRHAAVWWPQIRTQNDGSFYVALPVEIGSSDHVTLNYGFVPHAGQELTWRNAFGAACEVLLAHWAPGGQVCCSLHPNPHGAQGLIPGTPLFNLASGLRDALLELGRESSFDSEWLHCTYRGWRPITNDAPEQAVTRSLPNPSGAGSSGSNVPAPMEIDDSFVPL